MPGNENFNIIDELTGLYNRRYLFLRLDEEIKRAKRKNGVFSLFIVDIDYFKMVNDSFGHLRGDQVLKEFGVLLTSTLRDADLAFRYGGDEFVVILPDTGREDSLKVAQRLINKVKSHTFSGDPPLNLSVSVGISVFPYDGVTAETIFKIADNRLYEAKRGGRGTAVAFSELLPEGVSPSVSFSEIRLIGRDHILERVKNVFELAKHEKGGFIFLRGERGIGKTRLLKEIVKMSELQGYRNYFITTTRHGENMPFNTVKELLKKIRTTMGQEIFLGIPEAYQLEIYRLIPEFFPFKPDFESKLSTSSPYRLFRAILMVIEKVKVPGLVILIDDAHWMDRKSVEFFQYAASYISTMPVIVVFSYMSYKAKEMEELVGLLSPTENFLELEIGPLSIKEVESLLWEALKQKPPDDFVQWVYERTGGKPSYIAILIKSLIQQKVLVWDNGWNFGDYASLKLPRELFSALIYEYTRRPKEVIKVIELCAVIGDTFSAEFVASLAGMNIGAVLDIMDTMIREGFVEEREEYMNYRFSSRMIRDAVYELISEERRKKIHYDVASKLEEIFWNHGDVEPRVIAMHYLKAGMGRKAVPFLEMAVQKYIESYAYNDTVNVIHELLDILRDSRDYAALSNLYYKLGSCYRELGLIEDARNAFEKALELVSMTKDKLLEARIYRELAIVCDELGLDDKMKDYIEHAITVARSIDAREELLECLNIKALYYGDKKKNYVNAILTLESAIEIAEEENERKVLPKLYANYAKFEFMLNHYESCKEYYEKALDLAISTGDKRLESTILLNYAGIIFWIEGVESARKYYERAREIAQTYAFHRVLPYIYSNLGIVYVHMGEYSLAFELLEKTYNLYRQMNLMERALYYLARMGSLKVYLGNLKEGKRLLEEVIEEARKGNFVDPLAEAKLRLFIIASWEADIETGMKLVEELRKIRGVRKRDVELNLAAFYVEYAKNPLKYEKDILGLIEKCKKSRDVYGESQAVITAAKMYGRSGQKDRAISLLKDAIHLTYARGFYRYFLETSLYYLFIEEDVKEMYNAFSLVKRMEDRLDARQRLFYRMVDTRLRFLNGNFEGIEEEIEDIKEDIEKFGFNYILRYLYELLAEFHRISGDTQKSEDFKEKARSLFVINS